MVDMMLQASRGCPTRRTAAAGAAAIALAMISVAARAQGTPGTVGGSAAPAAAYADAVAQWIALVAPTGHERDATSIIASSLAGWTADANGSLILRRGTGAPRRVIACGIDEASYVVSEITDDGYVRLQLPERPRRSPLWDQFHEGQRVRVVTRSGPRPAVVGVRSVHLWRTRAASESPTTIEDLWVDVGARSRDEAARLGIRVLDPVVREWPPWRVGDAVAGPAAADRAGCAAVAASAAAPTAPATRGETIWVLSVRHAYGYEGLAAALTRLGKVDTLVLVDPGMARDTSSRDASPDETVPVALRTVDMARMPAWLSARVSATVALGVRSMFSGTLAETVQGGDIAALGEAVARAAGTAVPASRGGRVWPGAALRGVPGPPPASPSPDDSLSSVATLLGQLSDAYGVSGHEGPVRAVVQAVLPTPWRRQPSRVDSAGDLIIEAGPERDTAVFVAHLDELGFRITHLRADGIALLAPLGGFYPSLWEGQPALVHLDGGASAGAPCALIPPVGTREGGGVAPRVQSTIPGIFVPRARATTKQPDTMAVWLGTDSAALARCGVTTGTRVSGYKVASRLAATRFTARAIDDRAGCTALLRALATLDPARLTHKVIFVWSVREEVGLEGAAATAAELGPAVRRVYAVDTFVSSDAPLESRRFAYAPLGAGAALRAHDNSSVTPPAEVDRALREAERAGVPIQVGTTNGGNDGSTFVPWGAVDVALGWPLRYSHSPAEVVDLRDVDALGRLVAAMAAADNGALRDR